ncbi:MAG: hypothetical protein H7831_00795 [Magnetococcus sp. WYHC-3]
MDSSSPSGPLPPLPETLLETIRQRTALVAQSHCLSNWSAAIQCACEHFGLRDMASLEQRLAREPLDAPPWQFLLARFTIGESYFFRDDAQFRFLREVWLPDLITRRRERRRSLRVWSAGCAAGQELASLALLLYEHLPEPASWQVQLLGSDINPEAVASARSGRYVPWGLRGMDPARLAQWFRPEGEVQVLRRERLPWPLEFVTMNLAESAWPARLSGREGWDLILCRNVFIYLSREGIASVMARFLATLDPRGLLLLGASDPVDPLPPGWRLVSTAHGLHLCPAIAPEPDSDRTTRHRPIPAQAQEEKPLAPDALLQAVVEERWEDALAQADERLAQGDADPRLPGYRARALANLGQHAQALAGLESALQRNKLDPALHVLHALILQETGQRDRAEESLRAALFLEPKCVEAHMQMGLLRLSQNRRAEALRSLENALQLARDAPHQQHRVHEFTPQTFQQLASILEQELKVHRGEK